VYALQWSPLGRVVATWEQYATTAGQEAKPNLHLWDAKESKQTKFQSRSVLYKFLSRLNIHICVQKLKTITKQKS
jgi:hypothetical protein